MYDFTNLSDVEFERLSADILSRQLNVKLQYFPQGRDGGIDLVDDVVKKNILVQVKHYAKSSVASLLTSLKKEVDKVKKLKPKQYYICVSKELTAPVIAEIYELFKDYMDDTSNIITKYELVDFLNNGKNQDILRRNFKLWLLSDKLLKDIFNNHVFLDSEVLLYDIEDEFRYFVQTKVFSEALDTLKNHRLLMLYGAPGVGKSINSKMLAASFVKEDYIIRYTTDGQVSNIKRVLSENPDVKEVILLDDCLGQYYFSLKKDHDKELISLIKYINHRKNKILILNTRVTILNEAKRSHFEFRNFLDQEIIPLKIIDMEAVSLSEKTEIFYNHLSRNKIPKSYYETLKSEKKYRNIINHNNYNPRIIEFVTQRYRYSKVDVNNYYDYILKNLDNPKEVWEDEFDQKLEEIDRIFMYTLFSLTDTYTDIEVLKECFIFRLKSEGRSKTTVDFFSQVKTRLTKSLIKIIDIDSSKKIGVLNPSINDYMNNHLESNTIGLNTIRDSILYIEQLEKMYDQKEAEKILIKEIHSGNFINLKSIGNKKIEYLYYGIATNSILSDCYIPEILNNFNKLNNSLSFFNESIKKSEIVIRFLKTDDLFEFYGIGKNLKNDDFITGFVSNLDFKGITEVINILNTKKLLIPQLIERLYENFFNEVAYYIDNIEIDDYIDAISGYDVFHDLLPIEDNAEKIDIEIKVLRSNIKKLIKHELLEQLDKSFPYELIQEQFEKMIKVLISEEFITNALEERFNPEPDFEYIDYEEDDHHRYDYDIDDSDGVDIIFNRDIDSDY